MGMPEDIPEDREESYSCPNCDKGNITKDQNQGGIWQCDSCDWASAPKKEDIN